MPQSIKNFERLFLLSIIIGFIGTIVANTQENPMGTGPSGLGVIYGIVILIITGALVLLTSRKKSNLTKWVLTIFTVIGIIFIVVGFFSIGALGIDMGYIRYVSLAQAILQAVALYFLFTSDSRNYLQNKDNAEETSNN